MDTQFYEDFEERIVAKVLLRINNRDRGVPAPTNRGPLPSVRYLKQVEARKYLGGIDKTRFDKLLDLGLKQVHLATSDKTGSIRYDIQELDRFMAEHSI